MKRVVSNIQNLGFTIVNAPSEDKKVKQGGIILDQTLVNGQSQGVSVRLINGTKKTAAVKLDKQVLQDLLTAVNEVLATGRLNSVVKAYGVEPYFHNQHNFLYTINLRSIK